MLTAAAHVQNRYLISSENNQPLTISDLWESKLENARIGLLHALDLKILPCAANLKSRNTFNNTVNALKQSMCLCLKKIDPDHDTPGLEPLELASNLNTIQKYLEELRMIWRTTPETRENLSKNLIISVGILLCIGIFCVFLATFLMPPSASVGSAFQAAALWTGLFSPSICVVMGAALEEEGLCQTENEKSPEAVFEDAWNTLNELKAKLNTYHQQNFRNSDQPPPYTEIPLA